jgi:hypothetical protein
MADKSVAEEQTRISVRRIVKNQQLKKIQVYQ